MLNKNLYLYWLVALFLYCSFEQGHAQKLPFQSKSPIVNFALDENDTTRYDGHFLFERAYQLIEYMLTDRHPLNFAKAVFVVENCLYDGQLDYNAYTEEIYRIAKGIKEMANSIYSTAPSYDMALNYAIYIFYTQPCTLNNNNPYEYDNKSLMNDAGLSGGMVTNLLKSHKGTCHSLPYLYKIIADNVGA